MLIENANVNNLKDVTVTVPNLGTTVVVGPSGSGKSSLVYDVIYADAVNRLANIFPIDSSYLPLSPVGTKIVDMPPVAAVKQFQHFVHPRSTVGTKTGVWGVLRGLLAVVNENVFPSSFSFNTGMKREDRGGPCVKCLGLGEVKQMKLDNAFDFSEVPSKALLVSERKAGSIVWPIFEAVVEELDFDMGESMGSQVELLEKFLCPSVPFSVSVSKRRRTFRYEHVSALDMLEKMRYNRGRLYVAGDKYYRSLADTVVCDVCDGSRLNRLAQELTFGDVTVKELALSSLDNLSSLLDKAVSTEKQVKETSHAVVSHVQNLVEPMVDLGLGYLTLSRSVSSLSGGEQQRLVLANQVTSNMKGMIFVLDEPTAGLHASDVSKLLDTFNVLNKDNGLVIVEHNHVVMQNADHLIEVGPGAGVHGGEIMFEGSPNDIGSETKTGEFLFDVRCLVDNRFRVPSEKIVFSGLRSNNLKDVSVNIPLGVLTSVTGVSGSGKSSLVNEEIVPKLRSQLKKDRQGSAIRSIKYVSQSPIGKTRRSTVASYTGLLPVIRDVFAGTEQAKLKGIDASDFSANGKGGCYECKGIGDIKIEIEGIPVQYHECEMCDGTGYSQRALSVTYQEKTIQEVLDLTVEEGVAFFDSDNIKRKLGMLMEVGVGYLTLGQSSNSLSGGEAQRIKLAAELGKRTTKGTLYVLDEPTSGLHFSDVKVLLDLLHKLVDKGNSVLVIEHNLAVITSSDHVIDMGPFGGKSGGEIMFEGSPNEMPVDSLTGLALHEFLGVRNK